MSLRLTLFVCMSVIALSGCEDAAQLAHEQPSILIKDKKALGEMLFHDVNLSQNRTQACATCHNPRNGFIDNRDFTGGRQGPAASASLGDDGASIGDRNAPTVTYAVFSPAFGKVVRERPPSQKTSGVGPYEGYIGGQFWDGREHSLAAQAGGPPLNPIEMGMKNPTEVSARIQQNAIYISAFKSIYGDQVFDSAEVTYAAITNAIAEFESNTDFYSFDSKYDRMLAGEFQFHPLSDVAVGRTLFFSSDFSCAACHQLRNSRIDKAEVFTSFEYHNLGVPTNTTLRDKNGVREPDQGLALNPNIEDKAREVGKFKVPTLRNIAVTAPYMHNGVFRELETVMKFYEHARLRGRAVINDNSSRYTSLNPETNRPWGDPEVSENIAHELLAGSQKEMTDKTVKDFVCFLLSLTDERYEYLLDSDQVTACGLSDNQLISL